MNTPPDRLGVLVLGGGPDHEREVSIESSGAVAEALRADGRFSVRHELVGRLDRDALEALLAGGETGVVFPVLHGPWGEGGGVQRLLEGAGVAFVGSGSRASGAAMDKIRTKQVAAQLGVRVLDSAVLDPLVHDAPPFDLPVIVKPVCQGSSIGMRACRTEDEWASAVDDARAGSMPMMVEPMLGGIRELAVGLVSLAGSERLEGVPLVEITPAKDALRDGLYDYEAKYRRDDTRYTPDPDLPGGLAERLVAWTKSVAHALRVRHLCRADYLLDDEGRAVFLELNTMPGFTGHSLLPLACRHAGTALPALCAGLVHRAWLDARTPAGV
ncbi:MAG: D-alanine--D-alanine ligase [Phycisphaerales bacterium]